MSIFGNLFNHQSRDKTEPATTEQTDTAEPKRSERDEFLDRIRVDVNDTDKVEKTDKSDTPDSDADDPDDEPDNTCEIGDSHSVERKSKSIDDDDEMVR